MVSFGTSYNATRERTIDVIEEKIGLAYPDYPVYRAWTSKMIMAKILKRDGVKIDNVREAMARMAADGVTDVIVQPTHVINGIENDLMKEDALAVFRRRKIGFVFQSFNLVPVLSVYENIVLPLQLDGKTVDNAIYREIAEALGLKEKLNVLPNQLSGGQQQRVAIARALAAKPAILLADEPTGNLDSCTSQDVMGLLKTTSTKFSQTIVMITHNEEIAQLADRIIRIEDGRIVTGKAGEAL